MRYAKFISAEQIEYAPINKIGGPGEPTYTPYPEDMLIADGYKIVEETTCPADGKQYYFVWENRATTIHQNWVEAPDTRTPSEKREWAYENEPCVELDGELITVDEAEKIYYQYFLETLKNQFCLDLKNKIQYAKGQIRKKYPDPEPDEVIAEE